MQNSVSHSSDIGRLTSQFLLTKSLLSFEQYLDEVQPQLAKSLYMKLRYGVLQIESNTAKWGRKNGDDNDD